MSGSAQLSAVMTGSAQDPGSLVAKVDEFVLYESAWKALLRTEFEASSGEIDWRADGTMFMAGSSCISAVLNVRIVRVSEEDVAHCVWEEGQNLCPVKFKVGASVWCSRTHPCRDCWQQCGTIMKSGSRFMDILLYASSDATELMSGCWRLDADYVTHGLDWTLDCLSSFVSRRSEPLQRLIVEDLSLAEAQELQKPTRACTSSPSTLDHLAARHRLNASQQCAIVESTKSTLLLVHGPPGTGNPQTIVALLDLHGQPGKPACCLANGNYAVDNACKRACKEKVKAVRTGNMKGAKIDAALLPMTLERMAEEAEGAAVNDRAKKRRREWARTYIRESASTVVSTCTTLCANYLDGPTYGCMIVDEAVQATEPDTVAPLCRLTEGGMVVLVGDPLQLGCRCASGCGDEAFLEMSLYERLADVFGIDKCLLDTQYRMHPSISAWPISEFYDSKLRNGESVSRLRAPRGFP